MLVLNALEKEAIALLHQTIGRSYAPYSTFQVAAALIANDVVYQGYNMENASYGATLCAERSALAHAYAQGIEKNEITSFIIYTKQERLIYPCGICRQVLLEMLPVDVPIIIANQKEYQVCKVADLLPCAFTKEDL